MRNGDRMRVDVRDMGADFTFRVNGNVQRVPISEVVLLDFSGDGRNIPNDEISRADAASGNGFVVMKNGDMFNARLTDLTGAPLRAVFSDGRKTILSDVSRIYLGSVRNIPDIAAVAPDQNVGNQGNVPRSLPPWMRDRGGRRQTPYDQRSNAPQGARSVVVPANVAWTNTGLNVSRGQWLRFEPSGEIRLSFNGDDMATAAGAKSFRFAEKSQIPTIPVGALIGRIGNGAPFSIGDTTQAFQMGASGRLFLGVNDDHVPDNSGNFVVRIWEP
jgi:hypothetical protein